MDPRAYVGRRDADLPSPAFVVDAGRLQRNVDRMLAVAAGVGARFRPHVKTHKTVEIARLQVGGGPRRVVVSTLAEAEALAAAGFDDILYAVPIEPSKLPRVRALQARVRALHVLVDSVAAVHALTAPPASPNAAQLGVFVKVDAGYGRAGAPHDGRAVLEVVAAVARAGPTLALSGLYSHSGDSYVTAGGGDDDGARAAARRGAAAVAAREVRAMAALAARVAAELGVAVPVVSVGATPSAACGDAHEFRAAAAALPHGTALELHPGNYVFFDRQQVASGSCGADEVACYVLARVIGGYGAPRNELLVDAGSCALHKDGAGLADKCWGELLLLPSTVAVTGVAPGDGDGLGAGGGDAVAPRLPRLKLLRMTQEAAVVGVAGADAGMPGAGTEIDLPAQFPLGAAVRILPNHSCMTAAAHPVFYVVDADRVVTDVWTPAKFW